MHLPAFPLLTGFLQESNPQDIPMPSGTVLLLVFFALVFIVAWRLIANRSDAPLAHTEPHGEAHGDVHIEALAPTPSELHADPLIESRAQVIEIAPDDLTIVEGIGPKIKLILNENGIHTFTELAETSPEFLSELLRAHRLPNVPVTWPEQARLAAAGDWEALKSFQQSLTAGRRA